MARSLGRSTVRYSDRYSVPITVAHILAPTDADKRHRDKRHREVKTFMAEPVPERRLAQCAQRDGLVL